MEDSLAELSSHNILFRQWVITLQKKKIRKQEAEKHSA